MKFAVEGKLAFIVSNKSLAFGANFPINNVIITKNFGEYLTINTLFQIMGRAGRVGFSWAANCYLNSKSLKNIDNYIKCKEGSNNPEAMNLANDLQINLGFNFSNKEIVADFMDKKKVLIVYRYNCPESIFTAMIIIMLHLSLIKQSFDDRTKFNLSLFFDFIKLNTEAKITKNFKLEYKNDTVKYSFIYFAGIVPYNKYATYLEASRRCDHVVSFEHEFDNFADVEEIPNVMRYLFKNKIGIMSLSFNYVKDYYGEEYKTRLKEYGFRLKNFNFFKDLFIRYHNKSLLNDDNFIINCIHEIMNSFKTRTRDINYSLIYKFFDSPEEFKRNVEISSDKCEVDAMIKERLQIFIFNGKQGINFNKNSSEFGINLNDAINAFEERKSDIFLGLIIERKHLKFIHLIKNSLKRFVEQLDIPSRIMIIYEPFYEQNKFSKIILFISVEDQNKALNYVKAFSECVCEDNTALFFMNKTHLKEWTLC